MSFSYLITQVRLIAVLRCAGELKESRRSSWLNSKLQYVMLSSCKRPDPIYRNPSSQDELYRKLLQGPIIGFVCSRGHGCLGGAHQGPSWRHLMPVRDPGHESCANNGNGAQPVTRRVYKFTAGRMLVCLCPSNPLIVTKELRGLKINCLPLTEPSWLSSH